MFKSLVLVKIVLFSVISLSASAQSLNGYVAPMAVGQFHITTNDNAGLRAGARLEFARIQKWIALNMRVNTLQNYEDVGAAIRFYNYWELDEGGILTAGMGPGVVTARKGDKSRPGMSFSDWFVETAVTYLDMIGEETALIYQFGFDTVVQRTYPGDDKDGLVRVRPYITFGIAFGA